MSTTGIIQHGNVIATSFSLGNKDQYIPVINKQYVETLVADELITLEDKYVYLLTKYIEMTNYDINFLDISKYVFNPTYIKIVTGTADLVKGKMGFVPLKEFIVTAATSNTTIDKYNASNTLVAESYSIGDNDSYALDNAYLTIPRLYITSSHGSATFYIDMWLKLNKYDTTNDVLYQAQSTDIFSFKITSTGYIQYTIKHNDNIYVFTANILNVPIGTFTLISFNFKVSGIDLYVNGTLCTGTSTGVYSSLYSLNQSCKLGPFDGYIKNFTVANVLNNIDYILSKRIDESMYANIDIPNAKYHYGMNEASGNTLIDSMNAVNITDATIEAARYVNGKIEKCINRELLTALYITGPTVPINYQSSLSVWLKIDGDIATSQYVYQTDINELMINSLGNLVATIHGNGINLSLTTLNEYNDGVWHHMVVVFDSYFPKLYIYVDGILTDSKYDPTNWVIATTESSTMILFRGTATYSYRVDELSVFDAILTLAQVAIIWNGSNGLTDAIKAISFEAIYPLKTDTELSYVIDTSYEHMIIVDNIDPVYNSGIDLEPNSPILNTEFPIYRLGIDHFTISGWLYIKSFYGDRVIFSQINPLTGYGYKLILATTGRPILYMYSSSTHYKYMSYSIHLSVNQWYHFAISFKGWNMYINGNLLAVSKILDTGFVAQTKTEGVKVALQFGSIYAKLDDVKAIQLSSTLADIDSDYTHGRVLLRTNEIQYNRRFHAGNDYEDNSVLESGAIIIDTNLVLPVGGRLISNDLFRYDYNSVFAFSGWVKLDSVSSVAHMPSIIGTTTGSIAYQLSLVASVTQIVFTFNLDGNPFVGTANTTVLSDLGWHHIVVESDHTHYKYTEEAYSAIVRTHVDKILIPSPVVTDYNYTILRPDTFTGTYLQYKATTDGCLMKDLRIYYQHCQFPTLWFSDDDINALYNGDTVLTTQIDDDYTPVLYSTVIVPNILTGNIADVGEYALTVTKVGNPVINYNGPIDIGITLSSGNYFKLQDIKYQLYYPDVFTFQGWVHLTSISDSVYIPKITGTTKNTTYPEYELSLNVSDTKLMFKFNYNGERFEAYSTFSTGTFVNKWTFFSVTYNGFTSDIPVEYAMNNHNYEFTVINDTLRSSTQLAFRYGPYFHYEGIGNVSNLAYCKYLKTANTYYMYNNRYNDGKGSPSIAHVPYILKYPFIDNLNNTGEGSRDNPDISTTYKYHLNIFNKNTFATNSLNLGLLNGKINSTTAAPTSGAFTLEFDFKPLSTGIIYNKMSDSGYKLTMESDMKLQFILSSGIGESYTVSTTNALTLDSWKKVFVTFDGTSVLSIKYNDNYDDITVDVGSNLYNATHGYSNTTPFVIANSMRMNVKKFIVYNTVLTNAQMILRHSDDYDYQYYVNEWKTLDIVSGIIPYQILHTTKSLIFHEIKPANTYIKYSFSATGTYQMYWSGGVWTNAYNGEGNTSTELAGADFPALMTIWEKRIRSFAIRIMMMTTSTTASPSISGIDLVYDAGIKCPESDLQITTVDNIGLASQVKNISGSTLSGLTIYTITIT